MQTFPLPCQALIVASLPAEFGCSVGEYSGRFNGPHRGDSRPFWPWLACTPPLGTLARVLPAPSGLTGTPARPSLWAALTLAWLPRLSQAPMRTTHSSRPDKKRKRPTTTHHRPISYLLQASLERREVSDRREHGVGEARGSGGRSGWRPPQVEVRNPLATGAAETCSSFQRTNDRKVNPLVLLVHQWQPCRHRPRQWTGSSHDRCSRPGG